jgi:methylated-DNA-[protein]-cysteine S-methyltransferase
MPGALTAAILCASAGTVGHVRATRHRYAVDGWGVGELIVAGDLVLAHDLPSTALEEDGADGQTELSRRVAARVREHLSGAETDYGDLDLDFSWCTGFQRELARALRDVPWGEIVSYGELAALAGRPGAARAAGTFCAHNRFALVLPCHRVVSAAGIGGYGASGVGLKRRLLALEGIDL